MINTELVFCCQQIECDLFAHSMSASMFAYALDKRNETSIIARGSLKPQFILLQRFNT